MTSPVIIGIIGGTGIDQDTSLLMNRHDVEVKETPYGKVCDTHISSGQIEGVTVYIMARHGKDHSVNPSEVNYRANIWALVKQFNCTHLLVTSACGSLRQEIQPGKFISIRKLTKFSSICQIFYSFLFIHLYSCFYSLQGMWEY